ncbi:MAG: insulinase family protein, partial [Erysipelotrichaceae bacterium]|nr:insulinase family protein [Erysipelotrichaceae bacterium]
LQTFLNAMTYPDKTVYPISSRNDKDFINLMRVYLDAVFAPLCISRENIFRHEGWHYELRDTESDPLVKGVVYNEMKGAYSSPERLASQTLMSQLFADSSYGFSSGGDPEVIPTLTYEKFVESYHQFYNATNATIILDGDLNLEEVLAIIDDEYLSQRDYTPRTVTLTHQQPVVCPLQTVEFDATSTEDKTIIDYGYVVGDYDEYEKNAAFALISSVLADENQSPLKQAILQSGLAQDVTMSIDSETFQPYVEIMVMNTNPENEAKLSAIIRETLEKAVREGLNREEVTAALNLMEFKAREREFGSAPKGLVFAIQSTVSMYGGDPLDGLMIDHVYRSLREKVENGYLEQLIDRYLLHSDHCGAVMAKPAIGLESRSQQKQAEKMKAYKASLTAQQVSDLVSWNQQFDAWQQSTDTPEAKATLPKLDLSDISPEPLKLDFTPGKLEGTEIIEYHNSTEGIQYYTLYFDLKDMSLAELQKLNLLTVLLSHLSTGEHDVSDINRLKKNYLGALNFSVSVFDDYATDDYQVKLAVNFSCLKENAQKAWQLVREIITDTRFTDRQEILDIMRQNRNEMEMAFAYAGNAFGMLRALSGCDESSTVREYLTGYEGFRFLKAATEDLSDELLQGVEALCKRVFVRNRLTVSLMSEGDHQLLNTMLSEIRETDEKITRAERATLPLAKEAIEIAAQISFACQGVRLKADLSRITGRMMVIRKILTMDYLWTRIRAMGGAYGCGFVNRNNNLAYYSYRDPNPNNALNVYEQTGEYLRQFCRSEDNLADYIIGTIGDSEPLLGNTTLMATGDGLYFSNTTLAVRRQNRRQILTTDKAEIEKLLGLFDFHEEDTGICVVGGREAIEQCGDRIKSVLKV